MITTKKGQTSLEYVVFITIIIGALLGIQNYLKRGFQGRWKSAVDNLGEQYDPRVADSRVRHTIVSQSNTDIIALPLSSGTGFYTDRTDSSLIVERKQGNITIGSY